MIKINDINVIDDFNRTIMFRGVCLGGSSKVPVSPDGATHLSEKFYEYKGVSFTGRPFDLKNADTHFSRLKEWGFNLIRFIITWEAVEHEGPGKYDNRYLDFLYKIISRAGEYGFFVIIDPHQDVWSRWTGGDGAPAWTLETTGFNIRNLHETGSALIHQEQAGAFPHMIWPSNYTKLAAATMFTLFFAGNDFAPLMRVRGEPVQEFLQNCYINAIKKVAQRLKGLKHVIGYGTMNEPCSGYIGWRDITIPGSIVNLGETPSPFASMALGEGIPQKVPVLSPLTPWKKQFKKVEVNKNRKRAWQSNTDCIWRQHGVWDIDSRGKPRLKSRDYFYKIKGKRVNFSRDYLKPFLNNFAKGIQTVDPKSFIFIEDQPHHDPPDWEEGDAQNIVYAPHWYDGVTLFLKKYIPGMGYDIFKNKIILGKRRVEKSFAAQLGVYRRHSVEKLKSVPTLIGEIGIPFDLNNGEAYRTKDFSAQIQAFDRSLTAVEKNLLHCAIWNYTPDNDNERGDRWNGEDLSIFSEDQMIDPEDINSGGRALESILRPYPRATAGEPLRISFDYQLGTFAFFFRHDPDIKAPTEIFVPNYQYPGGYVVKVSDGLAEINTAAQLVTYHHSPDREEHSVIIRRA